MLNRINQLGLTLAVFAFAGLGTAHAQDENPCGDDMDNPCMEDTGDDADMDNPCGDANPCGDDAMSDDGGGEEEAAMGDDAAGHHSMVTATGKIKINAAVGVNLSADAVADPIALAPDVVYGVMDKLDATTPQWESRASGHRTVADFASSATPAAMSTTDQPASLPTTASLKVNSVLPATVASYSQTSLVTPCSWVSKQALEFAT